MAHYLGPAGDLLREREVMSPVDLHAEREKIRREIEELEKSLDPAIPSIEVLVSDSSLDSDSDVDDLDDDDSDAHTEMEVEKEGGSSDDDDIDNNLPADPETCLQMNLVYQEVIQEKIEEVNLLIAQNKEQQKEIMCEVGGPKMTKAGDGKLLPLNMFLGHFMKPYFKDKVSGIGPPANEDTREKTAQGIKSFEELLIKKWKSREKSLLNKSVISDRLQRLLQPKLLKLSYLNQKLEKAKSEMEKKILEKQVKEAEREIEEINHLPEEALLGNRLDEHDWEKISNINFDGSRNAEELRKFWQNWEHPTINKREWNEEEIEKLKEIAAKHNCLDWQTIAQELGTNRSAFQCLQKFQAYNKDFKRKEWTKEEDQMLLQLVQEMRVGSHIPYKKIAYYMEGRDSMQLIYRWTKSVDPSLRKGFWTPEEDAKLLAAVAKYGERDWYKIRTEVPGRSDAQCRDRYLNALHHDVKKGRWSLDEEEKLIELVEKHGVGHWTKIASELPHRTGSQCLSKWKAMIGAKKKSGPRKRLQKRRRVRRHSSSSSESSSEDSEPELMDSSEGEIDPPSGFRGTVPSLDLWIPTRTDPAKCWKAKHLIPSLYCSKSALVKGQLKRIPATSFGGGRDRVPTDSAGISTILKGIGCPPSTDINLKDPEELVKEAFIRGKQVLKVTLEDVRRVLRNNTYSQRKCEDGLRKPCVPSSAVVSGVTPGTSVGQVLQGLQNTMEKQYRRQREQFQRKKLERRLLMAVTPWVGNVLLPCAFRAERVASRQTKALVIQEQLQTVTLGSTPVFALFIQLFQIDTSGCMKVIRERKMRQSDLIKAMAGNARRLQQPSCSSKNSSGSPAQSRSQKAAGKGRARRPIALKAKENPAAVSAGVPTLPTPRQKPKTVSELLREKRLRESRAKKALQRTVILAPQVLVSPSVIIQHPVQQVIPAPQRGSELQTAGLAGSRNAQAACVPVPLPAFTPVVASVPSPKPVGSHSSPAPESAESACSSERRAKSERELNEGALGDVSKGEASQDRPMGAGENGLSQGCKKAQAFGGSSAPVVLQNHAFVPHQIALMPSSAISLNPAAMKSGPKETSPSTSTTCAPALVRSQQNAINLLPAILAPQRGSHVVPKNIMPITWVVTPQGLIPTSVQALVSVHSQGKQPAAGIIGSAAKNQSRTGDTSAPRMPLMPAEASHPPIRCTGAQVLSPQLAEGAPSEKTVCLNPSTRPSSITSLDPGHSSPSVSPPAPASLNSLSRMSDSSGERSATPMNLPDEGAALHPSPVLLPQVKPPASTPWADQLCLPSLPGPGESNNCNMLTGVASNPKVLLEGSLVQRPDRLLACNNTVENSDSPGAQVTRNRPIFPKPQSTPNVDNPPGLPTPSAEKNLLDVSLLSLEDEALVKEWLRGKRGIPVAPLETSLAYFPPFLCNLKTLSRLLLQKKTLEQRVSCLRTSEERRDGGAGADLPAVRQLVWQKLGDNPAYLLLKARFLAAFTLPAVLATLPPPTVTTTLSSSWQQCSESDEEESPTDKELMEAESCGKGPAKVPLDSTAGIVPGSEDADITHQGAGAEVPTVQSVSGSCADVGEARVLRTRRSARFRKRRRQT
ncbi:snRNA-activating protein complex subunit 4 isoform X1 [Chelonia mydas]|uniref:snRNA-activating protein complex subunit 4 isoform X1 n=2 Tax=Chelonia mydas TaxID=8469 RepID=UPI0018A1E765|nr:snRNA-activating protein complex subunit 4 isoform X1 [Chelonia mydas]XP_043386210.1 snRNA-activating protein complex subunit 4 isoform X1 [Chelonia mydas]